MAFDPGGTRPVLVVQANPFSRSRIATVLAVLITTNERLAELPGDVLLIQRETGLKQRSVQLPGRGCPLRVSRQRVVGGRVRRWQLTLSAAKAAEDL